MRLKSPCLKAFGPFTAGMPDNFLHNYDQLHVSGCLENSDGTQRRKMPEGRSQRRKL